MTEIFVVQQQTMGTIGRDLIGQGNKVEGAIVAVANMEILKSQEHECQVRNVKRFFAWNEEGNSVPRVTQII